jgi:hypothetical protein
MFAAEERERIREAMIERARSDARVVAAAAVGSSAGIGDRWSDLDLTFGIAESSSVDEVLSDWTAALIGQFNAAVLFDLPVRTTIYRVFLLPGALQVDLSFTPARDFGATSPRFQLLFGEVRKRSSVATPSANHMFGLGVHHVVRAHICIERGKVWQAEYWIHSARDEVLSLACLRHGLPAREGRGFDALPPEIHELLTAGLIGELSADALWRGMVAVAAALLYEAEYIPDLDARVTPILQELFNVAGVRPDSTPSPPS